MLATASYGLKLHEGARVVIVGAPNAGKSTLLNQLLGEDRAIVHHEAGTTRDVIEASIDLFGIPAVLIDVAGIRAVGENAVEQIGIERALRELDKAHAILWLADAQRSEPFRDEIIENKLAHVRAPVLKVLNKCDIVGDIHESSALLISAKSAQGLECLRQKLHSLVAGEACSSGEIFITRARQKTELEAALASLEQALCALKDSLVDEVIAAELRAAGYAFDRLFGKEISEDVLDKIFADFCIGK
ncbi:MAG: GTPase [Terriglobia bacterium]